LEKSAFHSGICRLRQAQGGAEGRWPRFTEWPDSGL
jgi:hypothetical protein